MISIKRTEDLHAGDVLVVQETDSKNYVLPISDTHPGREARVIDVKPFILTAGSKAGQVARAGRGNKGAPLYIIRTDLLAGGLLAATAEQVWTVAQ